MNDLIVNEEGSLIPADATILQSNDFSINESVLTGESFAVEKNESSGKNLVFQGTLVVSGLAVCKVTHIGIQTKMGLIEKNLREIKDEKTPLQLQISNFVTKMAAVGIIVFIVIWVINIYQTHLIIESLLNSFDAGNEYPP